MDCWEDFILSKSLCGENQKSKSNLYFENLEGFTISRVAAIEYGKDNSAREFMRNKLDYAIQLMIEDIRSRIEDKLRFPTVTDAYNGGRFTHQFIPAENGIGGVKISSINRRNTRIVIHGLRLYAEQPGVPKQITITDGQTAKVIDVETTGELMSINLDGLLLESNEVYISWDVSDINTRSNDYHNLIGQYGCNYCDENNATEFYIKGVKEGNKTNHLWGIQPVFSILCDVERMICHYRHYFRFAALYKWGVEMLNEWQASDRLNFLTLHSDEWAVNKKMELEEISYPEQLDNGVKRLIQSLRKEDKYCFDLKNKRYGEFTP